MANLRDRIRDYQQKQHKGTRRELREPWLFDGDLAEELEALSQRRDAIADQYAKQRASREAANDEIWGGVDTSDIDRAEQEALAPIDAELADLRERAADQTVYLVFRPVTSPRYDELFSAAMRAAGKPDAAQTAETLLSSSLASACFVGVESGGKLDRDLSWDELKAMTDTEDDYGSPLMTPGFVDYIETMVVALNRRTSAAPFSSKPSARTATR